MTRRGQFVINIPKELLAKYRNDRGSWELLVLALCMKLNSESSGIADVTEKKIRKLFRCGVVKAKRMLANAKKRSDLFFYDPIRNYLAARKFTAGQVKRSVKWVKGQRIYVLSAYCLKFEFHENDTITHKEVSRQLRDALWLQPLIQKQREDEFLSIETKSSHPKTRNILGLQRLGLIAGCHRTTVKRHIKEYAAKGKLYIVKHKPVPVADWLTGETLTNDPELLKRRPFLMRSLGAMVVRDPDEYIFPNYQLFGMWTNIIFNHKKRRQAVLSKEAIWQQFLDA